MLEPYTDDSLICIGLQMQQGYVGFFDLEQDTKHTDRYEFVLNSDCFNEWYKKDIAELKEKIGEQQATISALKEENEQLRQRYYALKKENDKLENNIIHLNEANDFRKKNLKIIELSDTEHNLKMLLANSDEQTERFIKGLQDENRELRQQLKEKQEEEKLYANEILELNKTKKEMLNFKQLGGDY